MKKFLAILLTLAMLFTIAAPAYAAGIEDAQAAASGINGFFAKIYDKIHDLLHIFVKAFGLKCSFCGKTIVVAKPDNATEVIEDAKSGETVELVAGDYGAIVLGSVKNVTIEAQPDSNIGFVTTADTDIEDLTITGLNLYIPDNSAMNAIRIDGAAEIDNLVIANSTFTGAGSKAGRAIYGTNPTATISIINCTFENMGYPIYTMSNNGGYAGLTVDGCTFSLIKSWAIMPQYTPYSGDLTVTNNTFTNCTGGLVKSGALTAGHTFTFANNTVINSTEHPSKNWFDVNATAGSVVIEGNTRDGVVWTPDATVGIKAA